MSRECDNLIVVPYLPGDWLMFEDEEPSRSSRPHFLQIRSIGDDYFVAHFCYPYCTQEHGLSGRGSMVYFSVPGNWIDGEKGTVRIPTLICRNKLGWTNVNRFRPRQVVTPIEDKVSPFS